MLTNVYTIAILTAAKGVIKCCFFLSEVGANISRWNSYFKGVCVGQELVPNCEHRLILILKWISGKVDPNALLYSFGGKSDRYFLFHYEYFHIFIMLCFDRRKGFHRNVPFFVGSVPYFYLP